MNKLYRFSIGLVIIFTLASCKDKHKTKTYTEELSKKSPQVQAQHQHEHKADSQENKNKDDKAKCKENKKHSDKAKCCKNKSSIKWDLPTGWSLATQKSSIRIATFNIDKYPTLDCALFKLAKVNDDPSELIKLWVSQLGLSPLSPEKLTNFIKSQKTFSANGGKTGKYFDFSKLSDKSQKSIIVALIVLDNTSLVLKIKGKVKNIKSVKNTFKALAESIK